MEQLGEAEGDDFRHPQRAPPVEGHIKVDVHDAGGPPVQQDVVQVSVAQPQQVAHLQ